MTFIDVFGVVGTLPKNYRLTVVIFIIWANPHSAVLFLDG
jgi:hypothetical protein